MDTATYAAAAALPRSVIQRLKCPSGPEADFLPFNLSEVEPDPGTSAEARPHDRCVWSGGSDGSAMGIPDLHGLGNAPESRDGHGD
jgi:hypothetical protein